MSDNRRTRVFIACLNCRKHKIKASWSHRDLEKGLNCEYLTVVDEQERRDNPPEPPAQSNAPFQRAPSYGGNPVHAYVGGAPYGQNPQVPAGQYGASHPMAYAPTNNQHPGGVPAYHPQGMQHNINWASNPYATAQPIATVPYQQQQPQQMGSSGYIPGNAPIVLVSLGLEPPNCNFISLFTRFLHSMPNLAAVDIIEIFDPHAGPLA
ncbi:hypothetical protein FB45DRAFT_1032945 [Roridomyces roridus]|uniref:Uncharacterized protein n=1 Tax=Roridomyces roridus TaxID=1738132 RepID=A0AAD7BGR3_9AGAR|nr:hypothetical protein FB45DRAFT_1032945 [Roridomyces roridus]